MGGRTVLLVGVPVAALVAVVAVGVHGYEAPDEARAAADAATSTQVVAVMAEGESPWVEYPNDIGVVALDAREVRGLELDLRGASEDWMSWASAFTFEPAERAVSWSGPAPDAVHAVVHVLTADGVERLALTGGSVVFVPGHLDGSGRGPAGVMVYPDPARLFVELWDGCEHDLEDPRGRTWTQPDGRLYLAPGERAWATYTGDGAAGCPVGPLTITYHGAWARP